jgi:hypothetical protein
MELIKKEMPSNYEIVQCGDLHIGSPNVSEESINDMIAYVLKTKNCYIVNIGDNIEAIAPKDKRFSFSNCQYQTAQQQADKVVELFTPVKDKILAWGTGNHELAQKDCCDWGKYMADALDAPYGGFNFKLEVVELKTHRLMHKLWFSHGSGHLASNAKDDIQREANKKAALKNKMVRSGWGDCIYMGMGHIHKSIIVYPTCEGNLYLTTNDRKINQNYHVMSDQNIPYIPPDSRFYATSPSFMKLYANPGTGYTSYAEMFGYEPSEIGVTRIICMDSKICEVKRMIL